MNIYEKLAAVQQELIVPKSRYNSFGEYNYRSLEDINDAVKPLLAKYRATIVLSDSLENIGGENVIKATAQFIDAEATPETSMTANGITVKRSYLEVTGYAGITTEKKKLDRSQLYGVASSYARKYAMNALLLIDDTKDADTDEFQKATGAAKKAEKKDEPAAGSLVSAAKVDKIRLLAAGAKVDLNAIMQKPVEALTDRQADALITSLERRMKGAE